MELKFFTGEYCPACELLKPFVKKICRERNIKYKEVDPTEEIEMAAKYNVAILPTIEFNGDTLEGWQSESDIIEFLSAVCA
jgi:thiol-disulfide isomerase/thioredoxin